MLGIAGSELHVIDCMDRCRAWSRQSADSFPDVRNVVLGNMFEHGDRVNALIRLPVVQRIRKDASDKAEVRMCRPYLVREVRLLASVRVVVALGRLAFDNYLAVQAELGGVQRRGRFVFGHDVAHALGDGLPVLISCPCRP